jgi:PAS domain S-box-containing protein
MPRMSGLDALDGEMAERTRRFDWSRTPVGDLSAWPASLKTVINILLGSRYAMWLGWGPEFTFFYNDAYARMTLGPKHPWALGRSAREVWAEIWPEIGPRAESVLRTGRATWDEGLLLFLERRGFAEETYHTFSYSPVPDDAGGIGGMLCVVTEDTERAISERRLRVLRELAAVTQGRPSVQTVCAAAAEVLRANPKDLTFALLYLRDSGQRRATLQARAGIEAGSALCPAHVELDRSGTWPFAEVEAKAAPVEVVGGGPGNEPLPGGLWPEPAQRALVLPLARPGQAELGGFLVAGTSPRRPFDDAYRGFLELVAGQIGAALSDANAFEQEKRRAEALAELDRAKTAFFSNVSHEFRTPLSLMLGPLEELLERGADQSSPDDKAQLAVVRRNGLRLQRLVNVLLDFSRIEAGRMRATFQPADLSALTRDIASNCSSACERAGLRFRVDCPELDEEVFVDPELWEKIVLNLLSNALKFTFDGEIAVVLQRTGDVAELSVRDTGTGIPASEVPRLFERFHRIENARSRTHEGSGIGLALTRELVQLHGGAIAAESQLGVGTVFRVNIPFGHEHLPSEQVDRRDAPGRSLTTASELLEELSQWLPAPGAADDGSAPAAIPLGAERPLVLVADDNADMREYLTRLLAPTYRVAAVADGQAALEAARRECPSLVVSDVMMPRLDGFGLARELRADRRTRDLPILLLSARAGEESRIDGLGVGADEYLVKPFSARELLTRVATQLNLAAIRRRTSEELRASAERLGLALDAAELGTWEWDIATNEISWSDRTMELFEIAPLARLSHEAFYARLHPDDAESSRRAEVASLTTGEYVSEYRVVRRDGSYRWLSSRGRVRHDEHGTPISMLGVIADIDERKRNEQALREADRRKDEFLAVLAHELRNPLAPLRSGLEVLKLAANDPTAIERSRAVMERQLAQMVRLIDDLMDVSRISRGKIELRPRAVALGEVLREAVETSQPAIDAKAQQLFLSLSPESLLVYADPTRLAQVFANLLDNASKYTESRGRIELGVVDDGTWVDVTVRDSGVGIPEQMLGSVFEMFTQVEGHDGPVAGGLGIGLSIVKRLVELHGGNVAARSGGRGKGSEFRVRLPLAPAGAQPTRPAQRHARPEQRTRRRVLVVDDNVDAAQSLAQWLEIRGDDVRTAHDGLDALRSAAEFRPEVVLLDIGMPGLDGYEAARRIRGEPWGADVVLIALTGWGQQEDRRRSREAGFDLHLVKPTDPALLEQTLNQIPARDSQR